MIACVTSLLHAPCTPEAVSYACAHPKAERVEHGKNGNMTSITFGLYTKLQRE